MTAAADVRPGTARAVLFDSDGGETALEQKLRKVGALKGVAGVAGGLDATLHRAAAHEAAEFLDLNVADVLVTAWCDTGALEAAARSTAARPGTTERVQLASQQIRWSRHRSIDLLIDEMRCGSVDLELALVFEITALEAEVRAGRLIALDSGPCALTASLSAQGRELVERRRELPLPRTIRIPLGKGIPLVHAPENGSSPVTHQAARP